MELGTRVIRGADWKWNNQDGGEGCAGTVVQLGQGDEKSPLKEQLVWVQWDYGTKANYSIGVNGKNDLRMLHTANGSVRHTYVRCDGCDQGPIIGLRWHCLGCPDFDLCTTCYMTDRHSLHHPFERIDTSQGKRVQVGTRHGSIKLEVCGIFKGAKVVRGEDWKYKDQDGGSGMEGLVTEIRGWNDESDKDAARVKWERDHNENIYRVGKDGKVELKCTESVSGGYYYVDHLPLLSADYEKPRRGFTTEERHLFMMAGKLHKVFAKEGSEPGESFGSSGAGNAGSPEDLLRKLYQSQHTSGSGAPTEGLVDACKTNHLSRVRTLLDAHPEKIDERVGGHTPLQVACQEGHCDIINELLDRGAQHITLDRHGNTAMHYSVYGDTSGKALKLLLAKGFDPNVRNSKNGSTPLHLAIKRNNDVAANILAQFPGCDVNAQDEDGETPLFVAITGQKNSLVDLLMENPRLSVTVSNHTGFNYLQHAALKGNIHAVEKLLAQAGDVLTVTKEDGYTSLHIAAFNNHCDVAKLLLQQPGYLVNALTNEKQTPLHLAATEGYSAMVELLLDHGADVNTEDEDGDTALHITLAKERLLGSDLGALPAGLQRLFGITGVKGDAKVYSAISRCLLNHGANVHHLNGKGETPLDKSKGTEVEALIRDIASGGKTKPGTDEVSSSDD